MEKIKKTLSVILAVVLLISALPTLVFNITANAYTSGYYTYVISGGEATITDCSTSISGDVTIPSTLGGYPVTGVGDRAFWDCENITSITIPEDITYIGGYLFYENNSLKTVNFNAINCETTTEPFAIFYSCYNLATVNIGEKVTKIPKMAFVSNDKIVELTIPENVTRIDKGAFGYSRGLKVVNFNATNCEFMGETLAYPVFEGCESLETINIGNNVKQIPAYAFYGCKVLEKITIPKSVADIGDRAFYGCKRLIDITIPDTVKNIGRYAFYDTAYYNVQSFWKDGALYIGNHLIRCDISDWSVWEDTFVVKSGTKTIASEAFDDDYSNRRIKKISIPKSVVSISEDATVGLTKLEEVYYIGSKSDKSKISIEPGNILLEYANWNYNSCIKSSEHTYSNNCDTSCNECKATRTITHTYSNNCDKSCNVCGKTRTVGAHKYSNNCDTTCNYCNTKRAIKHTYSNNCDTSCNVCKATRTITHAYKTTITKATLTKNGSIVKKCTVCGKVESSPTVYYPKTFTLSATSYTYNGSVKTPTVTVKDAAGKTLKLNTDYTVTYSSGRKTVGTYIVTVKMKGNYSGEKKLTFKINPANIGTCKLSATSYTYNGAVKTPSVTVKNSSGTVLTKDSSYTVTYASGRKAAGTYKVTIKGKGNYTGTKTLYFTIKPASLGTCKLSATSFTYDGKVKTPSVTVKNASGTKLTKGTSYTVTYSADRKNVGTYKVTIKGKGNYTGTKTLTFKINPAGTTVSKLTAGNKSIKVAITKKTTQVTGYQVQYSTSKNFSSAVTKAISKNSTTTYTLSSLKAKTTYYVRVRTYKTVNGTKYYSGWSTYKYVKTK